MAIQLIKYPTKNSNLPFRVARGHFATSHSHINYYIDLTMTKHRLSEAQMAATELCGKFASSTIIDTILCLDGTEVIGACMASELTRTGHANMNAHRTIYVISEPEAPDELREAAVKTIGIDESKHNLLFVGTQVWQKNLKLVLDTFKLLCARFSK